MSKSRALFLVAGIVALAARLIAAAEPLDPRGKPEDYKPGEKAQYAVWHDDDGWHLRTTTAKNLHHFKGSIHVKGGELEDVKGLKAEDSGKKADHFVLGPEKHTLVFDFATQIGEDGVDFHLGKDAKEIEWTLEFGPGDEKAPTKKEKDKVKVGKKGAAPGEIPFTTEAHPNKK